MAVDVNVQTWTGSSLAHHSQEQFVDSLPLKQNCISLLPIPDHSNRSKISCVDGSLQLAVSINRLAHCKVHVVTGICHLMFQNVIW